MKRQLEIDQKVNSIEIGLNPDRIAIGSVDYFKYAGSAYKNNVRIVPPQSGLPKVLMALQPVFRFATAATAAESMDKTLLNINEQMRRQLRLRKDNNNSSPRAAIT